ncbi:hypothetical protein F383_11696 [Gossypium arboreum]|uniref:Uncharacterized protein n=1 Tax=Gossypium arboreum TaxID=29729 RepID=A0A0B0PRE3_GOSAR|nr:hypothetical protein F383_11696 [Gossypium arboreum]
MYWLILIMGFVNLFIYEESLMAWFDDMLIAITLMW